MRRDERRGGPNSYMWQGAVRSSSVGRLSLDGERTLHSGGPCGAPGGVGGEERPWTLPSTPQLPAPACAGQGARVWVPVPTPCLGCFSHASVCRVLRVSVGLSLRALRGTPVVLQRPVDPGDTSAPGAPAQLGRNRVCWIPNCHARPVAGCPLRWGAAGESPSDLASRQTGGS